MAIETTRITSEALQASIRSLLPSQVGFGDDLHATNLITPIIDLTATAEGSVLRSDLQAAIAFGNATAFSTNNTSETLISNTGFYRVFGTVSAENTSSTPKDINFEMTDGVSTKVIYGLAVPADSTALASFLTYDFTVFLADGVSLIANVAGSENTVRGSIRQIADVSGNLVNPIGFTAE
jgi:hypothetical protein